MVGVGDGVATDATNCIESKLNEAALPISTRTRFRPAARFTPASVAVCQAWSPPVTGIVSVRAAPLTRTVTVLAGPAFATRKPMSNARAAVASTEYSRYSPARIHPTL